jgi:hypothetical protein
LVKDKSGWNPPADEKRPEENAMKNAAARIAAALVVLALASPTLGAEVDRRERRQQDRIAQGVESGQLTPHETARLERKEGRIDREVKRDRAANGGTLTPGEKAHINAQQNRASRQIYRQKHDAQVQ